MNETADNDRVAAPFAAPVPFPGPPPPPPPVSLAEPPSPEPEHSPLDLLDPLLSRLEGVTAHGDLPFDVPVMSWIEGDLWQGACAADMLLPAPILHLVSLFAEDRYVVHHRLHTHLTITMADAVGEVDGDQVVAIASWINACRAAGPTLVHCQAGLNRSSLVIAAALMLEGVAAADAIDLLRRRRSPAALCNPSFEAWLLAFQPGPPPSRYQIG